MLVGQLIAHSTATTKGRDNRHIRLRRAGVRSLVLSACVIAALLFLTQGGDAHPAQTSRFVHDEKSVAGTPLEMDVTLALVNVTVTDRRGRLVTGLERRNFHVFEDGIEQEIRTFSDEDAPISIGIILDMSGSMADKLDRARQAAVQFFKVANPQDEFFLVTFNDRARLVSPFTKSVEDLQNRLITANARGSTALFDGIYLGLSEMMTARNGRRALLIISDGGDNHSRYSESDIRSFVKEADCQLYAIGVYEQRGFLGRTSEEMYGPALLSEITESTGGSLFTLNNLGDLPDIAAKIGMELRNQYVIGYKPSNEARDGAWRKIKVTLMPPTGLPPLGVYAKSGYYAPNQ